MAIWEIYDKYLSKINNQYKMTIRRDVEGKEKYNEIKEVVLRHFPKSFGIEYIKNGTYYIYQKKIYNVGLCDMIRGCI